MRDLAARPASGDAFGHDELVAKIIAVVPNIIYVFNHDTQSNEHASKRLTDTLGYSADEVQAMGDSLMPSCCHPDDLPRVVDHLERIRRLSDAEEARLEYRMRHNDGSYVWLLSVDAVFDRNGDGEVVRHIGTATDITALKEAQQAQHAAQAELEVRARELQQISDNLEVVTYAATHDLKVPLNNIAGLIDALEADGHLAGPGASQMAEMVRSSCCQAEAKIEAIVRAAEARAESTAPESLAFAKMFEVLRRGLSGDHSESAAIETDFAECERVRFSAHHLESICGNLLTNAMKFADPGRPLKVEISSRKEEDRAMLSVSDNGIGLDVAAAGDKIFSLFGRAHTDVPGSGIGLYTVRETLKRAGGSIKVESVEGDGATFIVDFGPGSAQ